jgi:molybdopterin molybdotransferase
MHLGDSLTENLSVQQALQQILKNFNPLESENVPILNSSQRVLYHRIQAEDAIPGFTNSSMDGFAVRSADLVAAGKDSPISLTVIEDIPAGSVPHCTVSSGQAARIMTGAPLPEGADAVVPVENTAPIPDSRSVWILSPAAPGQYIRQQGQDLHAGQVILEPGRILQPQDMGMLASLGRSEVAVYRRPRIGLFSSGDELVAPGQPLGPGQIYDSNRYFLAGLLTEAGAEVIHLGTARDDPAKITQLLAHSAAAKVDLIVTSAGVSVGVYDFVRQVIETNGKLDFWRVNMRPGKPLAFGSFQGIPLVGLPGNPVSAFVGCTVFILPIIRKLTGQPPLSRRSVRVILNEAIESDGRESFLRAQVGYLDGRYTASLSQHQGSGNLFSLVLANALLIIPSEVKSLPAGSEVEAWLIGGNAA